MTGAAPDWKASLAERLEPTARYRFDQPFVPVSSIAQQYYCEQKVEQEFIHGEVPSEVKDIGTELHDQVLEMEKVKLDDLVEHIEKSARAVVTFGVHGRVGEMEVIGIPDAVITERGRPKWVVELKTTRGDPTRLWPDQLVQVRVYGLLLETMGFDCSGMEVALVRWRQDDVPAAGEKEDMLSRIADALFRGTTAELESRFGMKFFVYRHDRAEAMKALEWAQGYWLGTREPVPTTSVGKCRVCEFNSVCPHSLANGQ